MTSYFYDSIHTEDINITLPMQKQYMTCQLACCLGQKDFHYPYSMPSSQKTTLFKVGYFIQFFLKSLGK